MYKKNYPEAIKHFEEAISCNSNMSEAFYNYGIACVLQNKFKQALIKFEDTYLMTPSNLAALYNSANCYFMLNDKEKSYELFEELIKKDSKNLEWRNYLASLYIDN